MSLLTTEAGTVESDAEDDVSQTEATGSSVNFSKDGKTVESDAEDELLEKETTGSSINFSKDGKTVESDVEDELLEKETTGTSKDFHKEGDTIESDGENELSEKGTTGAVLKEGKAVDDDGTDEGIQIKEAITVESEPEEASLQQSASLPKSNRTVKTPKESSHAKVTKCNSNSRFRSSETFDEHDEQSGQEVSVENEVFVPMPSYHSNKMGFLREQMEDHRVAETVDEGPFHQLETTEARGRVRGTPHRIILKVSRVIHDKHNRESPIKGLPMEPLLRNHTDSVLFGRGVGVDIYLHDMLASKRHMDLSVLFRNPPQLLIRNVSDKKGVMLNDSRKIEPGQSGILQNNDTVTIACTTFLVEIAQGDVEGSSYELLFYNLTDEHSLIPGVPRAEAQHRPDLVRPQFSIPYSSPDLTALHTTNNVPYDGGYPSMAPGPPLTGQYMAPGPPLTGQYMAPGPPVTGQYMAPGPPVTGQYIARGQYPIQAGPPQAPVFQNVYQRHGYNTNPLMMAGYPAYVPNPANYGNAPLPHMFSQMSLGGPYGHAQMTGSTQRMYQYTFAPSGQSNHPVQHDETQEGRQEVDKTSR